MRFRALLVIVSPLVLFVTGARADTIRPKTGDPVRGVIQKMENGRVTIQVGDATRVVNLADIDGIDFDTPHLTEGTARLPLDHFLKDFDAQEMVRLARDLKQIKKEVEVQLEQIQKTWQANQPIGKDQIRRWDATKETFQTPMKQYQEIVRDMYMHVLAQVDDYNRLAGAADKVYVGVKGVFNVGSPLLPPALNEMSAKQVVPKSWYDKIFYEGYSRGYKEGEAFERLTILPPAQANSER